MLEASRFYIAPQMCDRIWPTSHVVDKGIIWMRDERNSFVKKMSFVALSMLAAFGTCMIGFSLMAASPLLGKAIFFLPSFLGAGLFISNTFLNRSVEKEKIQISYESIQNVFGGPEEFLKIPELELNELGDDFWISSAKEKRNILRDALQENGATVLARRLKPAHLTESLMRWQDVWERRFISFKLLDNTAPDSEPFVLTLCESSRTSFKGAQGGSHWMIVCSKELGSLSLLHLRQIVCNCHSKYKRV